MVSTIIRQHHLAIEQFEEVINRRMRTCRSFGCDAEIHTKLLGDDILSTDRFNAPSSMSLRHWLDSTVCECNAMGLGPLVFFDPNRGFRFNMGTPRALR